MFEEAKYESRPFHLGPGDILVVISDGVTDAQNPTGQMFGEQRLLQVIRHEAPSGGQAIEKKLLRAIEAFTEGTAQNDDITFMAVEKFQ
jgi:serine phosphatase RsbU (regulator of sigma subunit)